MRHVKSWFRRTEKKQIWLDDKKLAWKEAWQQIWRTEKKLIWVPSKVSCCLNPRIPIQEKKTNLFFL